jgi:endonuclease YncB( thermonuclease family)
VGPLPAGCTPGAAPTFRVAGVTDGATLVLADGRTVTLAGVETPLPPLDASDRPSPAASAAHAALALAVGGVPVRVAAVGSQPDRYGRWRANVFGPDGQVVAARLVGEGLARVHRLPGDPPCVLALLDAERGARIAARGMWADPAYRIRSALDPALSAETGTYALVAGQIFSIGHGDVMIFVNFGHDYGHDFTVMIAPSEARALTEARVDVDRLAGKRVLVRGMIEDNGGPAIRLGHPTDIEVLDRSDGGE